MKWITGVIICLLITGCSHVDHKGFDSFYQFTRVNNGPPEVVSTSTIILCLAAFGMTMYLAGLATKD